MPKLDLRFTEQTARNLVRFARDERRLGPRAKWDSILYLDARRRDDDPVSYWVRGDDQPLRWIRVCCGCGLVYPHRERWPQGPHGLAHCLGCMHRDFPTDAAELRYECGHCGGDFLRAVALGDNDELRYDGGVYPRYCSDDCRRLARSGRKRDARRGAQPPATG